MEVENLTWAALLTAGGAGAAALVVRQLIQVIKVALPAVDARVSGALMAFVLTAAAYVAAFFFGGDGTPNGALMAFISWLTCATAAIGIDSAWSHYRENGGPSTDG